MLLMIPPPLGLCTSGSFYRQLCTAGGRTCHRKQALNSLKGEQPEAPQQLLWGLRQTQMLLSRTKGRRVRPEHKMRSLSLFCWDVVEMVTGTLPFDLEFCL